MATLTICNLEEDVFRALKERAKRHHRSLEAEVRELLRDVAVGRSSESLRDLADRIAALTPDERTASTWSVPTVADVARH